MTSSRVYLWTAATLMAIAGIVFFAYQSSAKLAVESGTATGITSGEIRSRFVVHSCLGGGGREWRVEFADKTEPSIVCELAKKAALSAQLLEEPYFESQTINSAHKPFVFRVYHIVIARMDAVERGGRSGVVLPKVYTPAEVMERCRSLCQTNASPPPPK